ncbi:uncharacterized protein LOC124144194 isoform X1 [Haliotis rufescens]|uniref:uncharacterized protein LOC124144194 isoform X1 n=2 Tax=Haliotis rufescens TaxID=6454 RepID=UPI00201EB027|nr:uncharacterized protein LOC124144194 isoform X1 [Haliotis rufescens]
MEISRGGNERIAETRSVIYSYKDKPFKLPEDLLDIVANPDIQSVSTKAPYRPKAGEVYIYHHDQDEQRYIDKKIWFYDGYRWRNKGKHMYPQHSPLFEKIYFTTASHDTDIVGFRRCVYIPINKELKYMVVHYFGTASSPELVAFVKSIKLSTGPDTARLDSNNSLISDKMNISAFTARDEGNLMSQIGDMSLPSTSGMVKKSSLLVSLIPHNIRSIVDDSDGAEVDTWVEKEGENNFKFSQKTFTDLMKICFEMRNNDYFWSFSSAPEVILLFGSCDLCSDLNDFLLTRNDTIQCLSYSTSPCLDGFFISVLSLHHPKFILVESSRSPPVIPLVFMIHQDKTPLSHTSLFNLIVEHLPALRVEANEPSLAIILDKDPNVMTVVKKCLPSCITLLSPSFIRREAQCWLTKNMHSKRTDHYLTDLEDLMRVSSKSEFESLLNSHKHNCSRSWLNFFDSQLKDDMISHCNNWMRIRDKVIHKEVLEENQCPPLEQVLYDLELCHEATMDVLIQALYFLHQFLMTELQRGKSGFGLYRLHENYISEFGHPVMVNCQFVGQPSEIVQLVMSRKKSAYSKTKESGATYEGDQGEIMPIKQEPAGEEDKSYLVFREGNMVIGDENVEKNDDSCLRETVGGHRKRKYSSDHVGESCTDFKNHVVDVMFKNVF